MPHTLALAAVLLAHVFNLAAQDGPGLIAIPFAERGTVQCGANQLTWNNVRSFKIGTPGSATLQAASDDGSVLLDTTQELGPGEVLTPSWCTDLLGDGSQVLAYQMYSGGAHCCFTATLVLLEPRAPHLLDVPLGNAGIGHPLRLSEGGPLQVIGGSDVFAYFGHLSFAASPFMPLVFSYDGQEYFEATRLFPGYLRDQVARAESDLTEAVGRTAQAQGVPSDLQYQEQESVALRLYGLHVLLGDADVALPVIQARLSPPAADWLGANAPAAADAITAAYN